MSFVSFPPTHIACNAKKCRRRITVALWECAGRETDGWREISGTTGAAKTLHTCPIHTLKLEELLDEP
ncbi:MAG: hypothetical protein KA310_03605 [Pseudomonadales bacterium]|nr:hypothetical protein [Pseudomonadales bacterium]